MPNWKNPVLHGALEGRSLLLLLHLLDIEDWDHTLGGLLGALDQD